MDPELTQKTELVDKDIKRVIIIAVFHMFRKLEERLNILGRDVEGIKKKPKMNCKDENYDVSKVEITLNSMNGTLET